MDAIPMSYSYFNEIATEMDLLAASSVGDIALVHRLLQQGANVDQLNESGWTSLMYAAHYGHYNVVKMLIDYGANVNVAEKVQGRTPLMLAASCGHTRCLEVLITLGAADIELTDLQGHNAAYYAIHSGHGRNKIIAKLLKIQGKSRSTSSNSTGVVTSTSQIASASKIRPLTKGRPENNVSSTSGNNNVKHVSRVQGASGDVSSNKISSTTKPEIVISEENMPTKEDSSPFPHGSAKINKDSATCGYYSPYLTSSRDGSPIGDQFTSSSSFNGVSSPFANDSTPQLTFDRFLVGKRRLPMIDRCSGQPSQKSSRRDQGVPASSSEVVFNLLASASCSSHHHQQIQHQQSTLTSSSSPSSSLTTTLPANSSTTEEISSKKTSPGVIGSQLKGASPTNINRQSPILSDASQSSTTSSLSYEGVLNRSRSPLPENLDTLLERIGLSQYGSLFAANGIDLYCFLTLNETDFEEIGITLLGHKRKLYMAQLRFRESVEIASTQERFFADWLLSERENLKKENHELKMKLKGNEPVNCSIYN